jgi:transcriptional regulator with XRE-family HTH domain
VLPSSSRTLFTIVDKAITRGYNLPMTVVPNPLGQQLRYLRELRRLPLRQVATRVGISPAYLSKVERGLIRSPSPVHLNAISEILGADATQVLGLAGYLPRPAGFGRRGTPDYSLVSRSGATVLSAEEANELDEYLRWIRHRQPRSDGGS